LCAYVVWEAYSGSLGFDLVAARLYSLLVNPIQIEQPRLEAELFSEDPELMTYLYAFPYEEYEVFQVLGVGTFLIDDNPAPAKETIRKGLPWEPHLIEEFSRYVTRGSTVLDIGAHIGTLVVPLAKMVGPEGRVYAFEPQKKVFRELCYNLRVNGITNVSPLRVAASSRPGVIELEPVRAGDGGVGVGKGGEFVGARTIDSFDLSNVSLIKIDVEGHEVDVLKGAVETVKSNHPVILIEIRREENFRAASQILKGLGYVLRKSEGDDFVAEYEG
jgi:FkbM family methyltransferase